MKLNKLFEDVFMDIDWSLYDDENADLSGVGDKIYRTANKAAAKWHPKTKGKLVEAIKTELENGNTDLNCIDTSEITDMSWLFDQEDGIRLSVKEQKTLDVSDWDVRNVVNMHCMFCKCTDFNQDLSKWDVRNVKDMWSMFCGCINFNGKDLSKWKVGKVEDMGWMFWGCTNFNQDLSGWDVRNVRNMWSMFNGCTNFNEDLSGWDVRNVENMSYMFHGCTKLKETGLIPDWYNPYKYK